MNIKIGDKHRLTSDKHNYIIEERAIREKGKNKGEIYWKQLAFYPRLEQAVRAVSERFIRESDETTVEGLKDVVHRLHELLEDVRGVK